MLTDQEENAVEVTANSVTQENTLGYELELSTTNMETDIQKRVKSSNNSEVTSDKNESPLSAHQLQSMLATFMTAMQAENAKLASNLSDELDKKLAVVTESLDTKFNSVSDRLDAKIKSMIAKETSQLRKENDQIRHELKNQLQTDVQLITEEVNVVRNSTETELNNCMQSFESERNRLNENLKDYKSQTEASMSGLKSVVNKNRDELENKINELTHEVRTVTSTLDEFDSSIQINKRNHNLEI